MTGPRDSRVLRAHGQEVVVWPDLGGRLAAWRDADGADWLQPIPTGAPLDQALRRGGCYPLAPYCNRIEHGRFRFQGAEIQLPAHPLAAPHSLHGMAWRRRFACEAEGEDRLRLTLDHRPDADWPWAFHLTQTIALTPKGLDLTLRLRNVADTTQPAGLGFHPFFPRRTGAQLRFAARGWWRLGPDRIPDRLEAVPFDRDFSRARPVPPGGLDDLYEGVGGSADIAWPAEGLALRVETAPALTRAIVFTPPGGDAFCFEPLSHETNAHNRPGDGGLAMLEPDEAFEVWISLRPGRSA